MWKLLIILIISLPAFAVELERNKRFISVDEQSDWKLSKDLFGIPFIYFSSEQSGQRSNISFTDTEVEFLLNAEDLDSTQETYQTNKKSWATQVKATPEGFIPYETFKNNRGHQVHKIGFLFSHEGKSYVEHSYYVNCNKRIVFSKALRLKENSAHDQVFMNFIQSLSCGDMK